MPRSRHGGRAELGQNDLHHRPTIDHLTDLVADTQGAILEIGAGDGALTRALARLGRPLTAIDLDEHRVRRLRHRLPAVRIEHADVLTYPLDRAVLVGNVPFHLTTPVLRRLLAAPGWQHAILLTQWEVARKRAGVGGGTMLTAQSAPWFEFALRGRVGAHCFTPRPSVDGGILTVARRTDPLVPTRQRRAYAAFVQAVYSGAGGTLDRVVARAAGLDVGRARRSLAAARVPVGRLPRDLEPGQWASLWSALGTGPDPHPVGVRQRGRRPRR